jgi:hypothetical protein
MQVLHVLINIMFVMFHIFCLTNTTKFEFVKRQYLHELMQTLK